MAIAISNATQTHAPVAAQPTTARRPTATPQPAATVNISATAKILQEATESQSQTAREAASGDSQARSLLAKEVAAEAARK